MGYKRILSSLLGFPLVIIVLVFGNKYVIDVAFSVIAVMSLYEFYNAFSSSGKAKPVQWIGYASCILIALIHIIPSEYLGTIAILTLPTALIILFAQLVITDMKTDFYDICISLFGIVYVVGLIAFLPLLSGNEHGKLLIWYLIFVSWGTDICAYFVGRKIGKHKFSKISPNKSIEGCVAGILGATLVMLGYTVFLNIFMEFKISYLYILGVSILLSIISQIGDFAASSIKRYTEIKDYGNLIPGHGGILDRIDSLIFVAPFAYILLSIII